MTINLNAPKIKICGVSNVEDAKLVVKYKAQYLGLIFVKSSPRYIEPAIAKSIVNAVGDNISLVGVFQNFSLEEMENIAKLVGFDYFQLHGQESPELCGRLSKPVIKAFQIANEVTDKEPCITLPLGDIQTSKEIDTFLSTLAKYKPYCQHFLFDKAKQDSSSNWMDLVISQIKSMEEHLQDYFFAGSLNVHNIQSVLNSLRPAVLDLASGIEKSAGIKSEALIADFCEKVQAQYNDFCILQLRSKN